MGFNKEQRKRYINILKEAQVKNFGNDYKIKIIVLHENKETCLARCLARENHPTIKDERSAQSALNTFFSKYERPTPDEGELEFRYPDREKNYCVVVDLDGTLCNIDHRLHWVKPAPGVKKNWKKFFETLEEDIPNVWCTVLINSFNSMIFPPDIVFASGRPDDYMKQTKTWLEKHDFSTKYLYMRCRGDHRHDYVAKEIILDFEILTRFEPMFFIDDRQQVVDLWRRRGYVALQCHPGDF